MELIAYKTGQVVPANTQYIQQSIQEGKIQYEEDCDEIIDRVAKEYKKDQSFSPHKSIYIADEIFDADTSSSSEDEESDQKMNLEINLKNSSFQSSKNLQNVKLPREQYENKNQLGELHSPQMVESESSQPQKKRKGLKPGQLQFKSFDWLQFLEFLLYHFTYYCVLGPLSLIIYYFRPGKIILYNLQFLGPLKVIYQQLLVYLLDVMIFVLYYIDDNKTMFFYGELIQLIASMIMRSCMIAIKYATYDPHYIDYLKKNIVSIEELKAKLYLGSWSRQTDQCIYEEAKQVLKRNDLEESLFYIEFFRQPKLKSQMRYRQHEKEIEAQQELANDRQQQSLLRQKGESFDERKVFSSYGLIKEFVSLFDREFSQLRRALVISSLVYAALRSQIPNLVRSFTDKPTLGEGWKENLAVVATFWNIFVVFSPILAMIQLGVIDLMRTNFILAQLTTMIAPKKNPSLNIRKLLPTVNFMCPVSLQGWFLLRVVAQDYGKQFSVRISSMAIMSMIIVLLQILFLVLSYLGVITIRDLAFTVTIFSDIVIFSLYFFGILFQGALINEKYAPHISQLSANRAILKDLLTNIDVFLSDSYQSKNVIMREIILTLKHDPNFRTHDQIRLYLMRSIRMYKDLIEALKSDEDIKPYRVLGVKLTLPLVQSMILGIGSAIGTIGTLIYGLYVSQL